jgi:uncharacterized membrane protein HdeD (DUF308 family)
MSIHAARTMAPGQVERGLLAGVLPPWWLFLVTGFGWIVVSLILLQFDYTSVSAISLLFGFLALAAGLVEVGLVFLAPGAWKLLNAILAIAFIAAAVIAFVHPGDTFEALAGVFAFVLVFAGTYDIVDAIAARRVIEVWWLQLVGGIIELGLGFWAAGYWGRSATLLVAWAAAFALIRGVRDVVVAFRIREIRDLGL